METPIPLAKHARILIVDDDASACELLRALLVEQGFVVECAGDGLTALEQAPYFEPDVVLTDLEMPHLDGIGLCERLHRLDPTLPVILMTAHDDGRSILRGLRAGVDEYLTKPLDFDLVLWTLRRAIGFHAARIEQEQARRHTEPLLVDAWTAVKRYEEILAVVAHDLRSPLGVIQLAAQLLLEDGMEVGGEARRVVQSITRSLAQSNNIIQNLLDEARLHGDGITLEYGDHPIEDLLDDVSDLRPLALQRGIVLDVRPPPEGCTLACDRAKVGQVLANLVGNALKFSPKGTTVTVWAEEVDGGIRLAVRDQGPGISEEAQTHLFERFWQEAGAGAAGIGLGLYIAKGIVDAHGGQIRVESRAGAGSTFFVALPEEHPATTLTRTSLLQTMTSQSVVGVSAEDER